MVITEILRGFFIGFGFVFGLIFAVVITGLLLRPKRKSGYSNPEELIEGFRVYLRDLKAEEKYEEIPVVNEIITELSKGKSHPAIKDYNIKKDFSIETKDNNGSPIFKIKTTIFITKKKNA